MRHVVGPEPLPDERDVRASTIRAGWLVVVLLGARAELCLTSAQAASAQQEARFSHASHVRAEWREATHRAGTPGADGKIDEDKVEYDRDCRGCHDYAPEPAQRVAPTMLCDRCHGFQAPEYSGRPHVAPQAEDWHTPEGARRFDHSEHRELACAKCHTLPQEADQPMQAKDSASACMECHGKGGGAEVREKFYAAIDLRLAQRAPSADGFLHAQHVTTEGLRAPEDKACRDCHASLEVPGRERDGEQFAPEACDACHVGGHFPIEPGSKPSRTAATFLHDVHRGEKFTEDLARNQLGEGCAACHAYDGKNFALGTTDVYAGCVRCHAPVAKHGSIDDCRKCHDFEPGKLVEVWKKRPPTVTVQRPAPATFAFGSQAHESVTGAKVPEDCAGCHRARIPELASRLDGQTFHHATHLGDARPADAKECAKCHRTMGTSQSPADIAFDPTRDAAHALYDLPTCSACHRSETVLPRVGESQPRTVLRFSHQDHLEQKSCVDCHVPRGERIELRVEGSTCAQCHGHDRPETTLAHTLADVESCRSCHEHGVPEHGEVAPVPRSTVASPFQGTPAHPRTDRDCTECHRGARAEAPAARPTPSEFSMRRPEKNPTPHAVLSRKKDKDPYFELHAVAERKTLCVDCHWGSLEGKIHEQFQRFESQNPRMTVNQIRTQWGSRMDAGFPGFASSH